jgi:hypothetical protein
MVHGIGFFNVPIAEIAFINSGGASPLINGTEFVFETTEI